jgi:hypothetical protein
LIAQKSRPDSFVQLKITAAHDWMAVSIGFPRPTVARRSHVAGAPFDIEVREVELADSKFALRQGATLVPIERR